MTSLGRACSYTSLQTHIRAGTGLQEVERCSSVQPETEVACLCSPKAGSSLGKKHMCTLWTEMSVNEHHLRLTTVLDSIRGSNRNLFQDCSN